MRDTCQISAAWPADALACGAIMSEWIEETPWMPRVHSRVEDRGFLETMIGRGWVLVARGGDVVEGFLIRDQQEVHALYVKREARSRGVGKALLLRAKAVEPVLKLWTFQANRRAQSFYLREGFIETGRSDGAGNDEGLPDIRYEWRHA